MLLAPVVATESIVADRLGPFDTPFQPAPVTAQLWKFFGVTPAAVAATIPKIERARHGAKYLMATESSVLAATFIYETGEEVLPIGGFTGTIPSPSLPALEALIRRGAFHLVLQAPTPSDRRFAWIARHCIALGDERGTGPLPGPPLALFYCVPASVPRAPGAS